MVGHGATQLGDHVQHAVNPSDTVTQNLMQYNSCVDFKEQMCA